MAQVRLSTEVKVASLPQLAHEDGVVLLGSCFTQNIGSRLEQMKFNSLVNPFGTIFNPHSLSQIIKHAMKGTVPEIGYRSHNNKSFNYLYHSNLSVSEFEDTLLSEVIQEANSQFKVAITEGAWLVLTLGTAWVYEKEGVGIVGNCHKQPESEFTRRCLDVIMVKQCMIETIQVLRKVNPDLKILFTVSPVRHARDGMRENAVSKATLILAVDELVRTMPDVYYFPAYEILLDELRDYRFYAADMLHPSEVAIDIIWNRLQDAWFSWKTKHAIGRIEDVYRALAHRPRNEYSQEHLTFLEGLKLKLTHLIHEGFDLKDEFARVQSDLNRVKDELECDLPF